MWEDRQIELIRRFCSSVSIFTEELIFARNYVDTTTLNTYSNINIKKQSLQVYQVIRTTA